MKYTTAGNIKELDKKARVVIGYPSTFGHIDSMHEIVDKGAFARTIEQWGPTGRNRIKALYQHDPAWLVGRPTEMEEDEVGLRTVTRFADTAMANDVISLIDDGIITEQSIGYDVIKDMTDDDGVTHLKELRLYEYSYVTWGANEYTPIVDVKTKDGMAELQRRMERMEKALRQGRFNSDELPDMMSVAIKQWSDMLGAAKLSVEGTPAPADPSSVSDTQLKALDSLNEWIATRRIEKRLTEMQKEMR